MKRHKKPANRAFFYSAATLLLLFTAGLLLTRIAAAQTGPESTPGATLISDTATAALAPPTVTPSPLQEAVPSDTPLPMNDGHDIVLLSIMDAGAWHLYLYDPAAASLTRVTDNAESVITPALSPDGRFLAFSSNRSGYWDIYVLDLTAQTLTRVTDTPNYDAAPAWSPDGRWLAYESYLDDNLEIQVSSFAPAPGEVLRITFDPGADHSPAWSPDGRYLAFVSNRSGDDEIWQAGLQSTENQFTNISNHPDEDDRAPAWSKDGSNLYWYRVQNGSQKIISREMHSGNSGALILGGWPLIDPSGANMLLVNQGSAEALISVYSLPGNNAASLPVQLPGLPAGMTWIPASAVQPLMESLGVLDADGAQNPYETPAQTSARPEANNLTALQNVNVPQPYLAADVAADYDALRERVHQLIGWNFLDSLENAFIPITQPPSPEIGQSWLYTGRAIALNPSALYGGWMTVVREEYDGQTYWRIYLKTRYQDGSQGMPIKTKVWDFTTRHSGDTAGYENGGTLADRPAGYWIDFTAVAQQFGWERVPSLSNWRTYMDGALFNQYVQYGDLTWQAAMRELYPPEALMTATRVPTAVSTPTAAQ